MDSGQVPGLDPKQHLLAKHIDFVIDKVNDVVEIRYGVDCQESNCPLPHTKLVFRSCPTAPCSP
jgi:hypothetical protein